MPYYIDIPLGWKYGFPKVIPYDNIFIPEGLFEWVANNGCPQEHIDSMGKSFYVRLWKITDKGNT